VSMAIETGPRANLDATSRVGRIVGNHDLARIGVHGIGLASDGVECDSLRVGETGKRLIRLVAGMRQPRLSLRR
jgi:hypothetical protein